MTQGTWGMSKILVVGGCSHAHEIYELLTRCGQVVRHAACAQAALERLSEEEFGLVFAEVNLPCRDGLAVTEAIRRCEAGTDQHLPVFGLCVGIQEGAREQCLAAGMDDAVAGSEGIPGLLKKTRPWLPQLASNDGPGGKKA